MGNRRLPRRLSGLFTIGWIVWVGLFIVLEGAALLSAERGDTLSEHVWVVVAGLPLLGGGVVLLLGWLIVHFVFPDVELALLRRLRDRNRAA